MVAVDHVVFAQNDRSLNAVLQFTDVPRPVVAHEHVDGCRRDSPDSLLVCHIVFFHKIIGKQQNVGFAFAEGGDGYWKNIQPVIEIFAEEPVSYQLFQIAVCGRNHPYINLDGFGTTNSLKLLFLYDPEQFCLNGQAQLADFIKKDGAGMGKFKSSLPGSRRSGESSFFMPEKLTFNNAFRQCRAVEFMNGLSNRLLLK